MSPDSELDPDAEIWLSFLALSGRRPATLQSYRACAVHFGRFLGGPLIEASRSDALRYLEYLTHQYKPGGVGLRVRSLRAFYGWCCAEGLLGANPFARLNVAVPKKILATPTAAEIDTMLKRAAGHRRDLAMLTLLVDTGCRKGEIAALERRHIDLRSGVVHFPVSKTEPRIVVLTDRAHRALLLYLRRPQRNPQGLWDSRDPYSLVTTVVRRYSMHGYYPHAFRRAFAVRWLSNGGSELGLMRTAGWSSREMIAVYTAANADQLAQDEMRRLFKAPRTPPLSVEGERVTK